MTNIRSHVLVALELQEDLPVRPELNTSLGKARIAVP
jgi:hypothetical protein